MTALEDSDEEYYDDPIQLIDFEQMRFSQLDKVKSEDYDQADSEGEVFIEKSKNSIQRNCFRTTARSAVTLPVAFFNIPQNVTYLNKCRPLFIKIVDCDKNPWYYKKYLRDQGRVEKGVVVEDHRSINPEDMQKHQAKPKIRPVGTPYESLKTTNTSAKPANLSVATLKDWQKVRKQNAIDQWNEQQVDYRKNLGLIGLKISQTTENIQSKKEKIRKKKDKHKAKSKKCDSYPEKATKVKNPNSFKDRHKNDVTSKVLDQLNNSPSLTKSVKLNLSNPPSGKVSGATNESNRVNCADIKSATPVKSSSCGFKTTSTVNAPGRNLNDTDCNPPTPAKLITKVVYGKQQLPATSPKSVPTCPSKGVSSAAVNKNMSSACEPTQSRVIPASSMSVKLPGYPVETATPRNLLARPTSLSANVSLQSAKNTTSSAHLPRLSENVSVTADKQTTNKNETNTKGQDKSHDISQKQKLLPNSKVQKDPTEAHQKPQVNILSTEKKHQNYETLTSLLNQKVVSYDSINEIKIGSKILQIDQEIGKGKKEISNNNNIWTVENTNPNDKGNSDLLKMKLFRKPCKNDNKTGVLSFAKIIENETNFTKSTVKLNTDDNKTSAVVQNKLKSQSSNVNNAVSQFKIQNEMKQPFSTNLANKMVCPSSAVADSKKVNQLFSQNMNIEDIVAKCKSRQLNMISDNNCNLKSNVCNSAGRNSVPQKSVESIIRPPGLQVYQTRNDSSQRTSVAPVQPKNQSQQESTPVISNRFMGELWVPPTVDAGVRSTIHQVQQNVQNGQSDLNTSCSNITISTTPNNIPQVSLMTSNAQRQTPLNTYPRVTGTSNVRNISSGQQMGDNIKIPCHIEVQPVTKVKTKPITLRRKSIAPHSEKELDANGAKCDVDKGIPHHLIRPTSTSKIDGKLNQTSPGPLPANPIYDNPHSYQIMLNQTHPNQILINPSKNDIQKNYEGDFTLHHLTLPKNVQAVASNQGSSHLQHSKMIFNLNAAAQLMMLPQKTLQQNQLGKISNSQSNRWSILDNPSHGSCSADPQTSQPKLTSAADVNHKLWSEDTQQQDIQRQLPPTCDVLPPHMVNTEQQFNPLNSLIQMTGGPQNINSYLNVPHPNVRTNTLQQSKSVNKQMTTGPQKINPYFSAPPNVHQNIVQQSKPIHVKMTAGSQKINPYVVAPPNVYINNLKQSKQYTHMGTGPQTFTRYLNVPPSKTRSTQGKNPQQIPVLTREVQSGVARPETAQYFPSNNLPTVVNHNQFSAHTLRSVQHPEYSQQFIRQNTGVDPSNIRNCAPIYDNVPQTMQMNIPYEVQSAWNYYHLNVPPPPQPPYLPPPNLPQPHPQCNIMQNALPPPPPYLPPPNPPQLRPQCNIMQNVDDPNSTINPMNQTSVAGTTVIGCNDTGLVRKININAAMTTDVNDKQNLSQSAALVQDRKVGENRSATSSSDIEKPVGTKKEMLDELSRANGVITPPKTPVPDLKNNLTAVNISSDLDKDSSPLCQGQVQSNPQLCTDTAQEIALLTDKLKTKESCEKNDKSSKCLKRPINDLDCPGSLVTDNTDGKDFSVQKSPKYSSIENTSTEINTTQSSTGKENLNKQDPKPSPEQNESIGTKQTSPPKIEKSSNNNTEMSSDRESYKEDLKRLHPKSVILETVTNHKRPRPGPLSRKPKFTYASNTEIAVNTTPIFHQGYSPPILPIPSYTKTLEILAKSSFFEAECRNTDVYSDDQFTDREISNNLETTAGSQINISSETPAHAETGGRKGVTEKEREKQEKAVRKISLDDYKKRISQPVDGKELNAPNIDEKKIETSDQDLGYDSDSTMRN